MSRRPEIGLFTVGATYVGTVVGAGFATGQEVLRFFTYFGLDGIYAVLGAALLFATLGALILKLGHDLNAESHLVVVEEIVGPAAGRILDLVITFFLFGGAAVMMAGAGAVFAEHWHLSRLLGTALMAMLSGATVLMGLRGVVASISAVAPVLIAMVLVISSGAIFTNGLSPHDLAFSRPDLAATPLWPLSMLLYVSYNLLLSVSVLGPLGREVRSGATAWWGGMAGGLALGLGTLFINLALLSGLPETARFEVPMLHLSRQYPAWVAGLYSLVLWAEVYTTAVASLYGLTVRLARPGTARFRLLVPALTLGALGLSQVGFAPMVAILFPAVGWLGLLFVAGLLWRWLRPALLRQG